MEPLGSTVLTIGASGRVKASCGISLIKKIRRCLPLLGTADFIAKLWLRSGLSCASIRLISNGI